MKNFLKSEEGSLSYLLLPRSISDTIEPMTCILVNSDEAAGYRG